MIFFVQEAATLPDWGKMKFTTYPSKAWSEILPGLQQEGLDLISGLVVYESGKRLTADEVRSGPFRSKVVLVCITD